MRFICWQSSSGVYRWSLLILAAASGAVLLSPVGCNRPLAGSPEQRTQASASERPALKVVHPEKKDVHRLIERPGYNIEAYERTALYAKIAGYVSKWNYDIGDNV